VLSHGPRLVRLHRWPFPASLDTLLAIPRARCTRRRPTISISFFGNSMTSSLPPFLSFKSHFSFRVGVGGAGNSGWSQLMLHILWVDSATRRGCIVMTRDGPGDLSCESCVHRLLFYRPGQLLLAPLPSTLTRTHTEAAFHTSHRCYRHLTSSHPYLPLPLCAVFLYGTYSAISYSSFVLLPPLLRVLPVCLPHHAAPFPTYL